MASGLFACTLQRDQSDVPAGIVQWKLHPNTVVSDGNCVAEYEVTVVKVNGDVWKGAQLAVKASDAHVLVQQPEQTDEQGAASATVRCTKPGAYTLRAYVRDAEIWFPLAGTTNLTCLTVEDAIMANPEAFPAVTLTALHATSAADLNAPVPLILTVADAWGRPLANKPVTLTTSRAGDQVVPTTGVTDAYGKIQVFLTATTLGTATIMAYSGTAVSGAAVQFVAYAADMAASTFVARPGDTVPNVDNGQVLELTLRDAGGRLVPHAAAIFSSDEATDLLTPQSALTDANGRLSVALTGRQPGDRHVFAATHTGSLTTAVTLAVGAPSSATSYVCITPNTLIADGVATSTMTAVINDRYGNPVDAQAVTFAAVGGHVDFAAASGSTTSSGLYSTAATSTVAATKTITVTAGAAAVSQTLTFVAGPPNLTLSTFTGSHTAVADGNAALVAQAYLVDSFGNPVPNIAVSLSHTGSSVVMTPPSGVTSSAGSFFGALTSTQVQALSYTMACEGQTFTINANFTVGPPSAATSSLTASPNTAIASNGTDQSTIVTLLRDAQGRILANTPVVFTSPQQQTIVSPRSVFTDASGLGTSALSATLGGNSTIIASSGPMALSATVGFNPKPAQCANYPIMGERPLAFTNANSVVDVAAVDFNGDGNADLAVLNAGTTGLQVYMGLGDGHFDTATSYATPGSPIRMAVTDINHDGLKDIVIAANGNYFLSLLGNADGTFGATNTVAASGSIVGLCTGDLNGDNYNDVIALSSNSLTGFTVNFGNSAGDFSGSTFYASSGNLRNCVIADLDLDGHPDLAITNPGNSQVDIWQGSSTGALTYLRSLAAGINPNDIQVGLIDADSYPDLAITNTGVIQQGPSGNSIGVYLGTGAGNFSSAKNIPVDPWPHGLKLVDMNSDGKLDLVVGTGSYESFTSYSDFTSRAINVIPGAGNGNFLPLVRIFRSSAVAQISVADFDHDGNLDIAYAMPLTHSAAIAFGQGSLAWAKMVQYSHYFAASKTIGNGDFNGDGNMDLVSSYGNGSVQVFLGTGGGNLAAPISLAGVAPNKLEVGDFNGDGFLDLAGYQSNFNPATVGYWKGAGNGNFTSSTFTMTESNNSITATASGDVNGDGIKDMIAYLLNANQILTMLGSAASPNFITVSSYFFVEGPGRCVEFTLVDINNDGKLDLVGACQNLVVYTGDGSGRFTASGEFIPNGTTQDLFSVSAADIDGDGYIDIVASSPSYIIPYINQKNGTFASSPAIGFPSHFFNTQHSAARMADITGDGILDIVVNGSGLLMVWPGQGNGAFAAPFSYPGTSMVLANYRVPSQYNDMAFADFDNNGRLDIATLSQESLAVFFNRGCSQ